MDAYAEIVEIGKAAAKAAGKDNWKPKWKSKPPPPPKPEPDIDVLETFEEATQQLYDRIMEMAQQEPLTPMLYRTTPGIGKTLSALHLASTMAMKEKQVFYGAPTRNMAWQMYDRIMLAESGNQKVIMLEGRHNGYVRRSIDEYGQVNEDIIDPNCHRYEKVEKAREKGYPSQHYVCASCPYWPHFVDKEGEKTGYMGACNYFKRVYEAAGIIKVKSVWTPIVVTTHHMLGSIICDSEFLKPDWVIVDEDPLSALRETIEWDEGEIQRHIEGDEFIALREVMQRTIHLATFYHHQQAYPFSESAQEDNTPWSKQLRGDIDKAHEFAQITLAGKALARMMVRAAQSIGVNLRALLSKVSLADTGAEKGEFISMTDARFDELPHHREPELASELLKVLQQTCAGDERAYKVSLRWDVTGGWRFVWDWVRRVRYTGPITLLDAYGEGEIAQRYLQREAETVEVHCKVRDNVTVKRYPHVRTSRSAMDRLEDRDEIFDRYVAAELQRLWGKKVVFYTQKRYANWLRDRLERENLNFKALEIKWWWQDRGDDSFGDFDAVVVLGTPYPNIAAERHFVNALYAGEAPLSWEKDTGYKHTDPRVRLALQARQEKEMLQAIFRIRPSRPRNAPQDVIIFSAMELPVELELPGAKDEKHDGPNHDKKAIWMSAKAMYNRLGFWTPSLGAFIHREDDLFEWLDAGGADADMPCPLTYYDMMRRFGRIRNAAEFKTFAPHILERILHRVEQKAIYEGKAVSVWGDIDKAFHVLDHLRIAMREPGVDEPEVPEGCDTTWTADLNGNRIMFDVEASQKFEHKVLEYFMTHHKLDQAKDYWQKLKQSLPWGFSFVKCIQKKVAGATFVIVPVEPEMVQVQLPDGTSTEVPFLSMRKEAELMGYDIEQRAEEIGITHLLEAKIIPFPVSETTEPKAEAIDGHPGAEVIPFPGAAAPSSDPTPSTDDTEPLEDHGGDGGTGPPDTT
jgi:hypothetical protein